MNLSAKKHFDNVAHYYSDFRNKGIVGKLVKKEITATIALLPSIKNKTVIDLGCGAGLYTKLAKDRGANVTSLDFSFAMAKITQKIEKKIIVSTINNAKFKNKFDMAICGGALEFIEDIPGALINISNLLKPDGIFILVYTKKTIGSLLYLLHHKIANGISLNMLSVSQIKNALNNANLKVEAQKNATFISYALRCKKNA